MTHSYKYWSLGELYVTDLQFYDYAIQFMSSAAFSGNSS